LLNSLLSRRFKKVFTRLKQYDAFEKRRSINYLKIKDTLEDYITEVLNSQKNMNDLKYSSLIVLKAIKNMKVRELSFRNVKGVLKNFFWRKRVILLVLYLLSKELILDKRTKSDGSSTELFEKSSLSCLFKTKKNLRDLLSKINRTKIDISRRVKKQSKLFITSKSLNIFVRKVKLVNSRRVQKKRILRLKLEQLINNNKHSKVSLESITNYLDNKQTTVLKNGLNFFKRCVSISNGSTLDKSRDKVFSFFLGKKLKRSTLKRVLKIKEYKRCHRKKIRAIRFSVTSPKRLRYLVKRYKKKSLAFKKYEMIKVKRYPRTIYLKLLAKKSKLLKPNYLKGYKKAGWFKHVKKRRFAKYRRALPNFNKLSFRKRRWLKKKQISKFSLAFKKSIIKFNGNSTTFNFYKKQKSLKRNSISKLIIKPFLRIDVLLWKLGFFPSVRSTRQEMIKKNILINGKVAKQSGFLKKGDTIKVLSKSYPLTSDFARKPMYFSFCEVDFYTRTVILLRNAEDFRPEDYAFVFRERIKESYFIRYLMRN